MSTFLLIHGACHGAWCWSKVVPLLEAAGHRAIALDLPGHGEDRTPASQVTLETYANRVCEVVREQPEPVVLVGHSMAGVVITQTAELCPESIRSLAYVCAFLPANGESSVTLNSQDTESMLNPNTTAPLGDSAVEFKKELAKEALYGKCSNQDVAFVLVHLSPQPAAPLVTPVQTTPARFGRVPRDYIECTEDRIITIMLQRKMRQQQPCRKVVTLDTDHSPFYSAPQALVNALVSLLV